MRSSSGERPDARRPERTLGERDTRDPMRGRHVTDVGRERQQGTEQGRAKGDRSRDRRSTCEQQGRDIVVPGRDLVRHERGRRSEGRDRPLQRARIPDRTGHRHHDEVGVVGNGGQGSRQVRVRPDPTRMCREPAATVVRQDRTHLPETLR